MNMIRTICLGVVMTTSVCAFGSDDLTKPLDGSLGAAIQGPVSSFVPKVGIRVGGGNWNTFMADFGVDVTFNVPILPIPALRFDGEVWGEPSNFGADRRGDAISLEAIQTFIMGYVGVGPSWYFTDNQGDHRSGIGLKVLGGMNLPDSFYVEAGLIFGPSPSPLFVTIGKKF